MQIGLAPEKAGGLSDSAGREGGRWANAKGGHLGEEFKGEAVRLTETGGAWWKRSSGQSDQS